MNSNLDNNSFNKNLIYLLLIAVAIGILYLWFCKKPVTGGNNDKSIFVLYYVNWCPHCRVVKPEWDKLEQDNDLNNVIIKKINCEENEKIAEEKNIEGFPTIQLEYTNGEVKSYDGERNYAGFKEFLNNEIK